MCKFYFSDDILEGNPTGSVLLLITIIFMYLSIVPFAVIIEIENTEEVIINAPNYDYMLQGDLDNSTGINETLFTDDSIDFENITTPLPYENTTTPTPSYENKTMFFYTNPQLIDEKRIHYLNNNVTGQLLPIPNYINFGNPTTEVQNRICQHTVFTISMLFTITFSLMLARFVMVASVGHEGGFMSHVNGYIQTTLCFFMILVQFGINLQLWFEYNSCSLIFNNNFLLLLFSYDVFLLICLILVTPFIVRTHRNYREGLMFTIAVYLIGLVWGIWLTIYYFVGVEWRHVLLASSVVATATILLICVFVPRTYLMMTGIVRDHLTNALPSLGHTQSHSVLDVNFRASSQVS